MAAGVRRGQGRGGRGSARRSCDQQLRAVPSRRHPMRVAARALAAVIRPLRHARPAATLAARRQGALDLLVRRGA